jgi:hypothetical protein
MLAPRNLTTRVLLGAADYIERHGWCQRSSQDSGGAVCAAWALTIAAGHDLSVSLEAGHRLLRLTGGRTVPAWNDASGRTKAEVVETLRSAAFAPGA